MTKLAQRAFSSGIISPSLYSRTDYEKWASALKDAANVFTLPQGGAQSRAGTVLAAGYDNSTVDGYQYLVPFEASKTDTYMLEFGDTVMRVLKNGAYVLNTAVAAGSVVDVTTANPGQLEMASSAVAATFTVGTLVYLEDPNGTCPLHQAVLEITAITNEFIDFKIVGGVTIDNSGDAWTGIGASATISEIYQVTSPFSIEDMPFMQYAQDVNVMYFADELYDPRSLTRVADDDWTFATITIAPTQAAPTSPSATNTVGTGSVTYRYQVTAVNEDGEESLPTSEVTTTNDLTTAGNYNTVSWTAASGAQYYKVYRKYNGIMSYIGITEDTSFPDENIDPDTAANPPSSRNPFSGTDDKPDVVAFIEQRLTLASTINNPQIVEMSTSVAPLNFNRAINPGASDAISFRMRSQKLNRVQHIIPAAYPLILTSGAEWYIETESNAPMQTGNFSLRPRTYRGSADFPPPVTVGADLLHVSRDGNNIYQISLEDVAATASPNITQLARHLFKSKVIKSMAYAQAPDSTLWVTLTDGSCYSLTYMVSEGILGWTRHEFGGTDVEVQQVAVVTEGTFDRPYFVVSRTIDGQTITLVETLDERDFTSVEDAYFVDCGLKYDSIATTALRGFLHLRGEDVSVLADGNVLEGISVDAYGQVDIIRSASTIMVGLGYDAYIITLPADFDTQTGASVGAFVSTSEVAVRVVDSRGIAVGVEGGTLNEVKEFTGASPIPLATKTYVMDIDGDWSRDQSLEVRQVYPLPMHVTAIAPNWDMEDG